MGYQLLAGVAVASLLFAQTRWLSRRSAHAGAIVCAGILARAAIGLALFWTSYLQLPVFQSLQLGDGFWTLMGDARGYYRYATIAVDEGLQTVRPGLSSPFFTKTLAVWMHIVGVSPAAGLLLNMCLYVSTCAVITGLYNPVGRWRHDLPLLVTIASVSFAPAVLLHGTQTLKEDLFLALIIAIFLAVVILLKTAGGSSGSDRIRRTTGAVVALGVATYCVAGIRAYYAVIVWASLAVALTTFALTLRGAKFVRGASIAALTLAVIWFAYWCGAGPYYRPSPDEMAQLTSWLTEDAEDGPIAEAVETALTAVDNARTGFILTGGATNITPRRSPLTETRPPPTIHGAQSTQSETTSRSNSLARTPSPAEMTFDNDHLSTARHGENGPTAPRPLASSVVDSAVSDPVNVIYGTNVTSPLTEPVSVSASPRSPVRNRENAHATTTSLSSSDSEPPAMGSFIGASFQSSRLVSIRLGLAVVFIPVSILKALSVVEFEGGRGLLPLADADTVFMDLSLITLLCLLYQRRQYLGDRLPLLVFGLTLTVTTAMLLGYVVTNFGTLYRLRYLVAVPVWALSLAVSASRPAPVTHVDDGCGLGC